MAKAKKSAAQAAAEDAVKRGNKVLVGHGLVHAMRPTSFVDAGVEHWHAGTGGGIAVSSPLAGDWYITAYWSYRNDPIAEGALLVESSIGLNVVYPPYLGEEAQSLFRYDLDRRLDGHGIHVQAFQVSPLRDRIHWHLPGIPDVEWPFADVLEFLLSTKLRAEISDRGWPEL